MALLRRLDSAFTNADDLPTYIPELPVSGVYRRYRALDATVSAGSGVPSLANLGSATGSATATSAAPTLRTSGGITYLEFDGTDDGIAAPSDAAIGAGAVTAYGVARYRAVPPTDHFWQVVTLAGLNGYGYGLTMASDGKIALYRGVAVPTLASPLPGTTWHVFVGVFNGASSVIRLDATESGPVETGVADMDALGVGPGVGSRAQVDVAEFGMFDRALDSSERAQLVSALRTQYGLA